MVRAEHDNLRAALDWWHEQEAAEPELRLIIACSEFWERGGYWTEGRQRVEAALERAGEAPADVRAGAERRLSYVVARQGDYARAKELAESAISRYEESGTDPRELRHAYSHLAISEQKLGNMREIARDLRGGPGRCGRAFARDDPGQPRKHGSRRAQLRRRSRQHRGGRGDPPAPGASCSLANNLMDLGFIALAEARVDDALPFLRESLAICRAERLGDLLPWAVEAVAAVAAASDAPDDAVRLLAATTKPREELAMGGGFYPIAEEIRERTLEQARAQLSEAAFAAAWAEGEALSLEEAAERAARV